MLIADPVTRMVVIIALLLLLGRAGEFIFSKTGVPDMIWLVLAGIVAGPVLHRVPLDMLTPVLPFFGAVALIVILGGGGLRLKIREVAKAAPRGAALAVSGFLFSVAGTCVFGELMAAVGVFPNLGLTEWIMIGSILGGTSSLVVMPAMAGGGVSGATARLLEIESCITDALCVIVAMVVIGLLAGGASVENPATALMKQVVIGCLAGGIGGAAMLPMLARLAGKPGHYTALLSGMLVLYAAVQVAGGNGALGVLTCALVLGNADELFGRSRPEKALQSLGDDPAIELVQGHVAFFMKSFFFFIIGLMFPTSPKLILAGAGLALVLALFRIPAVLISLWKSDFNPGERRLISACVPRGLAAGVMSTVPLQAHIPHMEELTPGIFSTIVFTILLFAGAFAMVKRRGPALAHDEKASVPPEGAPYKI